MIYYHQYGLIVRPSSKEDYSWNKRVYLHAFMIQLLYGESWIWLDDPRHPLYGVK